MDPLAQIYAIVQALIGMITANTAKVAALTEQLGALQADDTATHQALVDSQKHQAEIDSTAQALLTQLQALQASVQPSTDAASPPAATTL
jgi:hypothetical protein